METFATHDNPHTGRALSGNVVGYMPPITRGFPNNPTAEDVVSFVTKCIFLHTKQVVVDNRRLSSLLKTHGIETIRQADRLVLVYRCRYVRVEVCLCGPVVVKQSGAHGMRLQVVTYNVWQRESLDAGFALVERGMIQLDQIKLIELD